VSALRKRKKARKKLIGKAMGELAAALRGATPKIRVH
jgi:hypothetical protein